MTKAMADLLRTLYGRNGGHYGSNPLDRAQVHDTQKARYKAARQLEELGLVSLIETNYRGLYTIRTHR